ncbi:MAG: DUF835 domain-containing protein [Candidatus Methanoperedens sp.]|nr:DUF835 domain-containing protein [Candidatus Methanoperedens sp.]
MLSAIISLFTIFLYTTLGTYVLTKNPNERTNKIFALLMIAFIIWAVGTYNLGITSENASVSEIVLYIKLQLSGIILSLTLFVLFALSLTKTDKVLKNPFTYLFIIPSIYLLYLIWTSDVSRIEPGVFLPMPGTRLDLFLFTTIFSVAGIYLLLRHYTASKYMERQKSKLILTGAIIAILAAVTINIILPMFFDIYFLALSTLAPAITGVFFAYAVYHYGLFITPVPELSITSFCGADCSLCSKFIDKHCPGCKFTVEKYRNCEVYRCVAENGYSGCSDCPDVTFCTLRKDAVKSNFLSKPAYNLRPGCTYLVEGDGYPIFLDAVKHGSPGLVATTALPQQVREKYNINTTPMIWISDEAVERDVKPDDLKRLAAVLTNFMKKTGSPVLLLDGIDELVKVNGFGSVLQFIQGLKSISQASGSRLIITTGLKGENLEKLKQDMEFTEIEKSNKT